MSNDPTSSAFQPDSPGELCEFRASDSYGFGYRHFSPGSEQPRGFVVGLHGIQSHSGWYGYSCSRLAAAGYDVRFLDRRGSGLNDVDRGHAPHAARLINDVAQFLTALRHERAASNAPVILLGVSWGGKLAAAVAAKRPELLDGLALLYPGIRPRIRPSLRQRILLRLAERLELYRKLAPIPLRDPTLFTGEGDWQQRIEGDPLSLHEATVGFFLASGELDRIVENGTERIHHPALLMLAGRDRIIDNPATRAYFDRIKSSRKKQIEYSAAAHTLEFEPNRDEVFDDLIAWLNRLPADAN